MSSSRKLKSQSAQKFGHYLNDIRLVAGRVVDFVWPCLTDVGLLNCLAHSWVRLSADDESGHTPIAILPRLPPLDSLIGICQDNEFTVLHRKNAVYT